MCSQGLNVFRVWRDDAYLKVMLDFISTLYTVYALNNRSPPTNIFMDLPEYQRFLQQTVAIANGAELVLHVPADETHSPKNDQRAFLT